MSRWKPCKRRDFIKKLRKIGFDGPYSGTKHQFMTCTHHRLAIPSNAEYSIPQLRFILKEVVSIIKIELSADEWENL
ncbi:hypothetical protein ES708_30553 [subsurface metagenome]